MNQSLMWNNSMLYYKTA